MSDPWADLRERYVDVHPYVYGNDVLRLLTDASALLAAVKKQSEVVEHIRRSVEKPMRTWSAGDVVAASTAEFWADELDEALAALPEHLK